jgi:hypothetical protein
MDEAWTKDYIVSIVIASVKVDYVSFVGAGKYQAVVFDTIHFFVDNIGKIAIFNKNYLKSLVCLSFNAFPTHVGI